MIDRQKMLIWGVLALTAALGADRFYFTPWNEERKKLNDEIGKADLQLIGARGTVGNQAAIMGRWKRLNERLSRPKESDTLNEFVSGLQFLSGAVGLQNWSTKPGREQKIGERGEFLEHAVETTFVATWEAFVHLLLEVLNWPDFIKVQRLAVTSKYEKENRLDVEMRVSTIELVPVRAGGKP